MPNHPNRAIPGKPTPDEVRAARAAAGLTQSQAAADVCVGIRNWQQWEAGERGMHPGLWKLFRVLHPAPGPE